MIRLYSHLRPSYFFVAPRGLLPYFAGVCRNRNMPDIFMATNFSSITGHLANATRRLRPRRSMDIRTKQLH